MTSPVIRSAIADHLQHLADTPHADGPWWALRDALLAEAERLRTVAAPQVHEDSNCDGTCLDDATIPSIAADPLPVAERVQLLIPALRGGLDWLFNVEQPGNAMCTQFGRSLSVPEANRRLSFSPITFGQGRVCVVLDVIDVRRESKTVGSAAWYTIVNGFAAGEHAAFADAIRALGYDVTSSWNGEPGSATGSVSLSSEPHPSLWAAYLRYDKHAGGFHSLLINPVLPAVAASKANPQLVTELNRVLKDIQPVIDSMEYQHLHDIDAGGSCRDPQCGYNSDTAHDKAVNDYVRGEGPSPYGNVPLPCANPHHAHALNAALEAQSGADEDPITWAHCPDCHGDAYDHGTDLTGPHCGHFAGCPHC